MMMFGGLQADLQIAKEMGEGRAERERAAAREALRDQFAMAALTGLLARRSKSNDVAREAVQDGWSRTAYEFADAMIAARGGK